MKGSTLITLGEVLGARVQGISVTVSPDGTKLLIEALDDMHITLDELVELKRRLGARDVEIHWSPADLNHTDHFTIIVTPGRPGEGTSP